MINIVKGEDKTILVTLQGLDISTASENTVIFSTKPSVEKTLTDAAVVVTDGTGGQFNVTLSDADTALLVEGKRMLEVVIDYADNRKIFQKDNAILVKARAR